MSTLRRKYNNGNKFSGKFYIGKPKGIAKLTYTGGDVITGQVDENYKFSGVITIKKNNGATHQEYWDKNVNLGKWIVRSSTYNEFLFNNGKYEGEMKKDIITRPTRP